MQFPLNYQEPVYRPPSEGRSLLIQLTIGCSNNKCTYCAMYRKKSYSVRPIEQLLDEIDRLKHYYAKNSLPEPDKIFLCDGDALSAPISTLVQVLDKLNSAFPKLRRVSLYATANNMLEKTEEELQFLAERKLNLAYLGLESGNAKVLKRIVKGATPDDMLKGCQKLQRSGWKLSIIAMLGVGGREHSAEHVADTRELMSQISPNFFSLLTTVVIPETPMQKMVDKGLMTPLTSKEILHELYQITDGLDVSSGCIFRVNHVSNLVPLGGQLPKDKDKIVSTAKAWWEQCPEGIYPQIDPSMM